MNVHQNARLTVSCRVLLVERILDGREMTRVARELGVSSKTADERLMRYRDEGMERLKDRGSRPQRMPAGDSRGSEDGGAGVASLRGYRGERQSLELPDQVAPAGHLTVEVRGRTTTHHKRRGRTLSPSARRQTTSASRPPPTIVRRQSHTRS